MKVKVRGLRAHALRPHGLRDSGPLGTVKGVGNQQSWHLLSPLILLWCCLLLAGGKNVALHQQLLSLELTWKQQGHRFQLSPTKQVFPRKNLLLTLALWREAV